MATYQIQINETIPLGQSILALLRSAKNAVPYIEKRELTYEEVVNESEYYRNIDSAFADVRLMLDGKKQEKTLDELIYELQNNNN